VKAPPAPEPPVKSQADIAMEREKQKRLEQQRREAELEKERREAELEKKRREAELEKKREQELAKKKREQELAKKKEEQQKLLAEAKRKEEERKAKLQQQAALEEKKRQALREENMKRMQGMAGGTGAPTSTGTAQRSAGPSANWAGKVQAKVRPNIVFSDNVSGNPQAVVEVRLGPGGMILGKPRLVRSSGHPAWDEAVIRALERTESLPADSDGHYPSPVEISFKPKA
jgi:colicin import membrane protein